MGPNHMNLSNEIRRSSQWLHSTAYSASRDGNGNLRPVDDRRVGAPRLPAQPRHAVPDAAWDGEKRLSDLARAAGRARRAKILQSDPAGQTRTGARQNAGSRVHRRGDEELTSI